MAASVVGFEHGEQYVLCYECWMVERRVHNLAREIREALLVDQRAAKVVELLLSMELELRR